MLASHLDNIQLISDKKIEAMIAIRLKFCAIQKNEKIVKFNNRGN